MALLAFEDTAKSPVGDLLDHIQRQKTASELNAAILTSQCQEKDPKLPSLLKMMVWAQVSHFLNAHLFQEPIRRENIISKNHQPCYS